MSGAPTPGTLENITASGVQQRRTLAVVLVAVTVGGVIAIDHFGLPGRWRLAGIVTLWMAALCWLQASAKT